MTPDCDHHPDAICSRCYSGDVQRWKSEAAANVQWKSDRSDDRGAPQWVVTLFEGLTLAPNYFGDEPIGQ